MSAIELLPETKAFLAGKHLHLVGDQRRGAIEDDAIEVKDPATARTIARVPRGNAEDVDIAVAAARKALDGVWGRMTPAERERILLRIADAMEGCSEELAQIEALNQGKNIA